jgi:hypothetical protein
MTHIDPTCPQLNAGSPRRAGLSRSRRHGVLLAYDGVTASYIRDISTRAGLGTGPLSQEVTLAGGRARRSAVPA